MAGNVGNIEQHRSLCKLVKNCIEPRDLPAISEAWTEKCKTIESKHKEFMP